MVPKLFDVSNGVVKPTEHCYAIKFLKDIMDEYPEEYVKIYSFIYYMTSTDAEDNPFFNIKEDEKEEIIYNAVDGDFPLEEPLIIDAIEKCRKMGETAAYVAFMGMKEMLWNLSIYVSKTAFSHGRDGSVESLLRAGEKFMKIKESYDIAFEDLKKEQRVRGGKDVAYDQRGKTINEDDLL